MTRSPITIKCCDGNYSNETMSIFNNWLIKKYETTNSNMYIIACINFRVPTFSNKSAIKNGENSTYHRSIFSF